MREGWTKAEREGKRKGENEREEGGSRRQNIKKNWHCACFILHSVSDP